MKNLLLSVFPLREGGDYVRLSLFVVEGKGGPSLAPFVTSRQELAVTLRQTSIENIDGYVLAELDAGTAVQIPISDRDALIIFASRSRTEH